MLDYFLGYDHPYSIFYVAVLWSGWYGSLVPGLLATVLGGTAICILAILARSPFARWMMLSDFEFYWIVCFSTTIVLEAQHRAEQKALRAAKIAEERWSALSVETTQRLKAEQAASHAQETFRVAFENAPVGLCQVNLDGSIAEVNPAMSAITGRNCAELIGQPFPDTLYLPDAAEVRELSDFQRGSRSSYSHETCFRRQDGDTRWIVVSMSLVRTAEHAPQCAIAAVEDITDHKQAEEEMIRAQKIECAAVLAAGIAHDFNNLLTPVLGNASLAMETLPRNGELHKMLQGIVSAAERAARLTSQLLCYVGHDAIVPEDLDPSLVVAKACELVRPSVPSSAHLQLDLPEGLPLLHADRSQVGQITTDLVLNAVEAVGNDRPSTIKISTGQTYFEQARSSLVGEIHQGSYVFIRVQDDDGGIDKSILNKIFDPFFSTRFLGRGLGLAAVAGIVRRLKGAVLVDTTPGVGSTFTALFPLT